MEGATGSRAPAAADPAAWAAPAPTGLRRVVPIVRWLPAYERRWLRHDAIAGVTLWGLLVPEMIAYAGLAGLPPQAGLYTLLVTLAAYAIFGTSRHMVVAGTSASAVLLASTVSGVDPADPDAYLAAAATTVLFCGGLFLAAGLLRLGFIAQFLARPVIDGFVFGLAIFVTVTQLPPLLGVPGSDGTTLGRIGDLVTHLGDIDGPTAAVGLGMLALLFAGERWLPRMPGGLVALVLGLGLSAALDLKSHGVAVVGELPTGLPSLGIPHAPVGDLPALALGAAGMMLVIYSESLGVAQSFARKHGYAIDPDQDLIALGVANASSGFAGGLAAGGSLSQSAVNEGAGARSQVSPLVAAGLALVTVLVLTPLFENLPQAVLAALIIHAVAHLWKIAAFRRYRRERPLEFWVGIGTGAAVIAIGVLPALTFGIAAMLLSVIWHASRPMVSVLGRVPGVSDAYGDVERHPEYERIDGLLLLRLEAPLFYANAGPVCDRVRRLVGACAPAPSAVIIDAGPTTVLDITTAAALGELARTLRAAGIDLGVAEVHHQFRATAARTGVQDALGEDHLFRTLDQAVAAMRPR